MIFLRINESNFEHFKQ